MKKNLLVNLFAFTVLFFGMHTSSHAQKHSDLQLSIISPENDAIIPYGDTVHLRISVKNLGFDTLYADSDTLYYTTSVLPYTSSQEADIPPFDSASFEVAYQINNDSEEENESICVYLLPYSSTYVDTNQLNDTACVSYTLAGNGNVGISGANLSSDSGFKLFPNPAKQIVSLSFNLQQQVIVLIYNLLGRQLLHKDYGLLLGKQKQQLDISSLHPGLYMIEVQSGNQHWMKKLSVY